MTYYLHTNVFCICFIATVFGANVVPVSDQNGNKTITKPHEELKIKNLTLVSEGGSLLPSDNDLSLSKENITNLLTLDQEINNNKEKPVKPRKGVDNIAAENNAEHENVDIKIKEQKVNDATFKKVPESESKNASAHSKSEQTTVKSKEVHKKPLILSYEALASADTGHSAVKPSSNTMTSSNSQIPSPNEGSIIKKYITNANSHPGMIMPIVITILVVPMFAIVGYMAVKRGKEAWKNRHYKRMDFLLDGMYND